MENAKYINIEKCLNEIYTNKGFYQDCYVDVEDLLNYTCEDVQEVKHGYWRIEWDDLWPEDSKQICSVCHGGQPMAMNNDNYCPNCGAKMDLNHHVQEK